VNLNARLHLEQRSRMLELYLHYPIRLYGAKEHLSVYRPHNTQTNLDLRNTTLGYGFHFQRRNSRTFPIESLAHDSGCTLACVEYGIQKDLQIPTVKQEIRRYSSQYSARLSARPNDLIVNLIELPDNRRLRRHLPNDLHTRFLVQLLYL
jgi:UV DNA damage repair endonuclease